MLLMCCCQLDHFDDDDEEEEEEKEEDGGTSVTFLFVNRSWSCVNDAWFWSDFSFLVILMTSMRQLTLLRCVLLESVFPSTCRRIIAVFHCRTVWLCISDSPSAVLK